MNKTLSNLWSFARLLRTVILLFIAVGGSVPLLAAAVKTDDVIGGMDPGLQLPDRATELMHARADHWRLVGRTIIVKGNVYIPYGNLIVRADEAIVDIDSRDLEARGNISFTTVRTSTMTVNIDELNRLQQLEDTVVEITGSEINPLGNQKLKVKLYRPGGILTCSRLSGNLASGLLHFTDLRVKLNNFVGKAKRGIRQPGGELHLEDMEFSTCTFLAEDQEHYSISLGKVNLYPHQTEDGVGFQNAEQDQGEYSMWGYNGTVNIYGVPLLWLPMFYKPKDENPGLFQFQLGENSQWGYYALFAKKFHLLDSPNTDVVLDVDYYSLRGVGYGARAYVDTENSKTAIRGYSIYDLRPYEHSSDRPWRKNSTARLDIPHNRFDFQITHVTHLMPRLDFRAQLEVMSDAYMLEDFYGSRANSLTEPATYAALEYQADRFSASIYARLQVNRFFTTIQKLPEVRLDLPRQEIIPGWNLYYQGSQTADYMTMNWARFDRKLKESYSKLDDYQTGRFDSVNFLYYPLRASFINIVPRAGIRLTGYTNTSKTDVTQSAIYLMQLAANPYKDFGYPVLNYDNKGGSKFRFAAEIGVEANTKIYRSWQNVRSAFWQLDGLRHVCEPYVNYTFIPDPTLDRDNIYFFDDIDRISEQNFIRLGLRNRLQTRAGGFRSGGMREWFSMENYWDIYFTQEDNPSKNYWDITHAQDPQKRETYQKERFNHIGDFCTKLTFSPTKKFSIISMFSIDAGHNQEHKAEAVRYGRESGRPGISGSILNRASLGIRYAPIDDMIFTFSYDYKDGYVGRSPYSMGSTLTEIESGSIFDQFNALGRSQTLNFGVSTPITPDRKTKGSYSIAYDFEQGMFTSQTFSVSRIFHCVRVDGVISLKNESDNKRGSQKDLSFSINATLVGMEGPMNAIRRSQVAEISGARLH